MVSYPRRLHSGHFTCYLNRTYHVLTTHRISAGSGEHANVIDYSAKFAVAEEEDMKKTQAITAMLGAVLLCGLTLAQEPVVDIDKNIHPNLAEAQRLVVDANHYVQLAQKDDRYDMRGHAEKARQLLAQVNLELKAAAEAANASMKTKH